MVASAQYFDGKSAGHTHVNMTLSYGTVFLNSEGQHKQLSLATATLVSPVGDGAWVLEWPDGASVRFENAALAKEIGALTHQSDWVGLLEQRWRWAIAAIAVAVVFVWSMLTWGIPRAATSIAFALPQDTESSLGRNGMVLLDQVLFEPSSLGPEARARVTRLFEQVRDSDASFSNFSLELRSSAMGPNAFAVPGGVVVMTDELVLLAESDAELLAVLAHEVGHLAERHSLRILLQNSVSAVLVASITGDLTNISALSAAIPTLLVQSKYSRDFEREADQFAFEYLSARELPTDALSGLLLRMEQQAGVDGEAALDSWFSSHPPSSERVQQAD